MDRGIMEGTKVLQTATWRYGYDLWTTLSMKIVVWSAGSKGMRITKLGCWELEIKVFHRTFSCNERTWACDSQACSVRIGNFIIIKFLCGWVQVSSRVFKFRKVRGAIGFESMTLWQYVKPLGYYGSKHYMLCCLIFIVYIYIDSCDYFLFNIHLRNYFLARL